MEIADLLSYVFRQKQYIFVEIYNPYQDYRVEIIKIYKKANMTRILVKDLRQLFRSDVMLYEFVFVLVCLSILMKVQNHTIDTSSFLI